MEDEILFCMHAVPSGIRCQKCAAQWEVAKLEARLITARLTPENVEFWCGKGAKL